MQSMGFDSTVAAWDHRVQAGIRGGQMSGFMNRFGRERGLQMYADWTDRISAGEVPAAPDRPRGQERNVVITMWDWGRDTSYIHDEIVTDKRNPRVNAGGPVYGVDGGHGALVEVNPLRNSARSTTIPVLDQQENPAVTRFAARFPVPSLFYGGRGALDRACRSAQPDDGSQRARLDDVEGAWQHDPGVVSGGFIKPVRPVPSHASKQPPGLLLRPRVRRVQPDRHLLRNTPFAVRRRRRPHALFQRRWGCGGVDQHEGVRRDR